MINLKPWKGLINLLIGIVALFSSCGSIKG